MPLIFYAIDEEFAAATGSNVNITATTSEFDNPPNNISNLTITANADDPDPRNFEVGDTYDVSWSGGSGSYIEDAVVVRSDPAPDGGGGGVIVLEGYDENGDLVQIVWTPGFNLEEWYWDNYNASAEPQFYVEDTNTAYSHEFICFAEDTRIATAMGPVRAGELWPGDMVATLDAGPQPIRWMRRRSVRGHGANTPVLFTPGAIGNVAPLRLSPQHRVLVDSPRAELLFGAAEVLVPAKALVNGEDIRFEPCPRIGYVHLLLPDHQVIFAEGAACESLLPGDMAQAQVRLPDWATSRPYDAVRPVLSFAEAIALGRARPPPIPEPLPHFHPAPDQLCL